MTGANFQNGLQAYYTFDKADTDQQRNILRDRSGYGRHATMEGGVTTGGSSPVGEAFTFDATDDRLSTGVKFTHTGPTTAFMIVKAGSENGEYQNMASDGGSGGLQFAYDNADNWKFGFMDGDSNLVAATVSGGNPTEWKRLLGYWDGDTIFFHRYDNKFDDGYDLSTTPLSTVSEPTSDLTIGANNNSAHFDGSLAMFARWDRLLTRTELEQLKRVSARKVSNL